MGVPLDNVPGAKRAAAGASQARLPKRWRESVGLTLIERSARLDGLEGVVRWVGALVEQSGKPGRLGPASGGRRGVP